MNPWSLDGMRVVVTPVRSAGHQLPRLNADRVSPLPSRCFTSSLGIL